MARNRFVATSAFTVLELLIVIAMVIALAGLVLATMGYVQKKGARARAEEEIAALSAALETYKADNGIYPSNPSSDALNARNDGMPGPGYEGATKFLYKALSGDSDGDPTTSDPDQDTKNYFAFNPNMLSPNPPGANTYIRDPFGNSYGYSTIQAANPNDPVGYKPTFDLWSTGGVISGRSPPDQSQWIKNW
jgi:type II secretory pathway pseudopilin PulG